jgi:hypothetical protein
VLMKDDDKWLYGYLTMVGLALVTLMLLVIR